jgi:hypothetical protein
MRVPARGAPRGAFFIFRYSPGVAAIGLTSKRRASQMDTVSILMEQYGGKVVVPLDVVCRDYFSSLTVPTLVRKISAGEIDLPLIRIERSPNSARGVRIQDLALYIDARPALRTRLPKPDTAAGRPDNAALTVEKPSDRQPTVRQPTVPPTGATAPPETEGAPTMEKALTLKMAAHLLKVSYGTVYAHRVDLGFFQIGSVWRVWPDTLKERLETRQKEKANPKEKASMSASNARTPSDAWVDDAHKAEKEFAERVANRVARRRRKADVK